MLSEGVAAARAGNEKELGAWLESGNDPNAYDSEGWTPLLWASVRGHAGAVRLLLDNAAHPADAAMAHRESKVLPIQLAGQSGDVETASLLLDNQPDLLDAAWELNGHGVLLQAVFYGHMDLAKALLERGARTDITTARGLGPFELASQFQNQPMIDLIRPFDSPTDAKATYYQTYLKRIAPDIPSDQKAAQQLGDKLVDVIAEGLKAAAENPASVDETLAAVRELVEEQNADVNRLGGPLQQPPLIVTTTGNNGFPPNPALARLRNELAAYLLEKGADPTLHEKYPMAVQTVIRAAVFNHLEILQKCAEYLEPQRLADAINEIPLANGLTAMHDTVLRSTMAAPDRFEGYLDQTRWFLASGGRCDIEDYSGVTQRNIAENCGKEDVRRRLLAVMDEYA